MVPSVRSAVRWATRSAFFENFVAALERWSPREETLLRVLMYHRVDEPSARPELAPCVLSATPAAFAQQMEFLAHNYRVITLQELLDAIQSSATLPSRSVLITFDDAYRDFAEHAWPILKRFQLPATLFVPTAFPGGREGAFWWDRLHQAVMQAPSGRYRLSNFGTLSLTSQTQRRCTYRRLADYISSLPNNDVRDGIDQLCDTLACGSSPGYVLSWGELRLLANDPKLTLACHTRTHPLLDRVPVEQARQEVFRSLADLQREIGDTPPVFAYPGGAYTEQLVEMLRAEGFQLAFTTTRGLNDLNATDPLRLRRINVGYRCSLGLWRAQLHGFPWIRDQSARAL